MKDLSNMFKTDVSKLLSQIGFDTFVISDTHFNHKGVLEFEPSRAEEMKRDGYILDGLDEDELNELHTEWIIRRWNDVVGPEDIVICLGDFAWKGIQEIIPRLNGRKILILGNHDRKGPNTYNGFEYVVRGAHKLVGDKVYIADTADPLFSSLQLQIDNIRTLISHYPATTREHRYKIIDDKKVWQTPINTRINELIEICEDERIRANIHGHTHSKNYEADNEWQFVNASLENIGFEPVRIIVLFAQEL